MTDKNKVGAYHFRGASVHKKGLLTTVFLRIADKVTGDSNNTLLSKS